MIKRDLPKAIPSSNQINPVKGRNRREGYKFQFSSSSPRRDSISAHFYRFPGKQRARNGRMALDKALSPASESIARNDIDCPRTVRWFVDSCCGWIINRHRQVSRVTVKFYWFANGGRGTVCSVYSAEVVEYLSGQEERWTNGLRRGHPVQAQKWTDKNWRRWKGEWHEATDIVSWITNWRGELWSGGDSN